VLLSQEEAGKLESAVRFSVVSSRVLLWASPAGGSSDYRGTRMRFTGPGIQHVPS
jgi:hypothetical protein